MIRRAALRQAPGFHAQSRLRSAGLPHRLFRLLKISEDGTADRDSILVPAFAADGDMRGKHMSPRRPSSQYRRHAKPAPRGDRLRRASHGFGWREASTP